jgi:coenzyme F420-0:L-glutamate ligase/coenzyme F420-1:gamma-L-glutamate ligase
VKGLQIIAVEGLPEVQEGDDLARLISERVAVRDGDILVVAQKVVSKSEGRFRDLTAVQAGPEARELALRMESDPRLVQVVLDESVRVVRSDRVLIVETKHGFVCANAGVDHSNVPGDDNVTLLPVDPDASASALRERLREVAGADVGVVIADTFGRPWRVGIENVALGIAGLPAFVDYRGQPDDWGKELRATVVAVADELAAAAELVMGKTARVPAAVIRGYHPEGPDGRGRDLIRPAEFDLFR